MTNSIKQMLRTPLRTGIFLVLIAASIALFTVGLNLWVQAERNLKKADEAFVTIGTVEQKENAMATYEQWDAYTKEYTYYSYPVYDSYIPESVLQLEGVEFISGPEKRGCYGAYVPDYLTWAYVNEDDIDKDGGALIAEITPVEDCVPSEPVAVKIGRVIYGGKYEGTDAQFCDHQTENPHPMEGGKTYLAQMFPNDHDGVYDDNDDSEFYPFAWFPDMDKAYVEVTDGFYESDEGLRWINLADGIRRYEHRTIMVTPTHDTQLITAFHNDVATIVDGRDISADEFSAGERVCLISQTFAERNNINVGDALNLQLYFKDMSTSASYIKDNYSSYFSHTMALDAEGRLREVFEANDYKVVGIYFNSNTSPALNYYNLSPNEVIVPTNSIEDDDSNNVSEVGPMKGYTTSFRIPNGTIDKFMDAFSALPESDFLDVQFYDSGYDQFADGIKNLRIIALVLFGVGLASALAVIAFMLYFYIVKQRKRTAIERALGLTRRQCVVSLLAGIMLLACLGAMAGCAIGVTLSGDVQEMVVADSEYFSTSYSRWITGNESNTEDEGQAIDMDESIGSTSVIFIFTGTLAVVCMLSLILIRGNLDIAPIYMLSSKGDV